MWNGPWRVKSAQTTLMWIGRARRVPASDAGRLLFQARETGAVDVISRPDSSVVVFGSVVPWYEALLIAWGSRDVVTVEYNVRCGLPAGLTVFRDLTTPTRICAR